MAHQLDQHAQVMRLFEALIVKARKALSAFSAACWQW